MSNVPDKLFYTKEHEWVLEISATKFRIGITDYAQAALGDIVYIQLPKEGSSVSANSVCGEVESTKSVSEIEIEISTPKLQESLLSAKEYQELTA